MLLYLQTLAILEQLSLDRYPIYFLGLEPPEKRPRISLKINPDTLDDGEGTLVINTSDPTQAVSRVQSLCNIHQYDKCSVLFL